MENAKLYEYIFYNLVILFCFWINSHLILVLILKDKDKVTYIYTYKKEWRNLLKNNNKKTVYANI